MPQHDNAPAGLSSMSTRLDHLVGELEARGLAIVNRMVYEDDGGDGTGGLGWLWVHTKPRCFPDEKFDVMLTYSEAEAAWSLSTPAGAHRVAAGEDVGAAAGSLLLEDFTGRESADPQVRAIPEWIWMALAGIGTSVVLPFLKAIAGKSAEDAYAALKSLLRKARKDKPLADGEAARMEILDPEQDIRIIAPDPFPEEAVRQLAVMGEAKIRGHILIWNEATQAWVRYRRQT